MPDGPAGDEGLPLRATARRPTIQVNEAFQVDIITALFASLLVFVLIHAAAQKAMESSQSRMDYRSEDQRTRTYMLKSFASPFEFRDVWLVKDGLFGRVDLIELARRYAEAETLDYETTIEGVDVLVRTHPLEIDAFRYELVFFSPGLPAWLAPQSWDAISVTEAVEALPQGRGLLIYVWHDQGALAAEILARLRHAGIPFQAVHLVAEYDSVIIALDGALFEIDKILRAY